MEIGTRVFLKMGKEKALENYLQNGVTYEGQWENNNRVSD